MRERACAALVKGTQILMVHIMREDEGLDYWTLPGGGLKPGEAPIDAVQREVYEETGMRIQTSPGYSKTQTTAQPAFSPIAAPWTRKPFEYLMMNRR